MTVLLVRHAHAGRRHDWDDDDRLRPLSPKGRREADGLVKQLASFPIDAVLSSPFTRCTATVQPLADARGLRVGAREELAEGRAELAVQLVELLLGEHVAACTHGDVVPEILAGLVERHGCTVPDIVTWPKGSTWVLEDDGRRFVRAAYLPPPTMH